MRTQESWCALSSADAATCSQRSVTEGRGSKTARLLSSPVRTSLKWMSTSVNSTISCADMHELPGYHVAAAPPDYPTWAASREEEKP